MNNPILDSGIAAVGNISWGAHFCQFYRTQADLIEILIPYFEAGLKGNECCLWVTSDQLNAKTAEELMVKKMPDFQRYLLSGQMEILSIMDWYAPGQKFDADAVLQGWIEKEAAARAKGFTGLRLTGDTFWVERSGWNDFMEYEDKVNHTFQRYNFIALCTYCLDKCTADDVIDVCCHHQFALARRKGNWELLESPSLKIAKQHLNQLNIELETRVEARTKELNASLQARDEFLAMLGHELRNPLAPIRNATEVIRALTSPESPISASAAILDRQVHHLTGLVDDLLDVGRIMQGRIQLHLKPTSLVDVIEYALELSRPFIDQRRQSLSIHLPNRYIKINADTKRLAQVFGNVLHNAAKYSPDGGHITINAFVEADTAVISIRDSGTGIPSNMLVSIFDLFVQLPRSLARSDGGLGIGLTLVKRITEMHGGAVEASSEGLGSGATFTIRLPIVNEIQVKPNFKKVERKQSHQGGCILIVDDNVDSNESFAALLNIAGYQVECAADGPSGVELAKSLLPVAMLVDIGLPGFDGYEVARRLRADSLTDQIRLIAVTGYGQDADIALAKEAGFDAHLLKPASLEDILTLIGSGEGNLQ